MTVKKVIHNFLACNPNVPIHNVDDLLDLKLSDMIPSTIVRKYTTNQIDQVKEDIQEDLISAPNTMKIHEVYSTRSGEFFLKHMSKENNAQHSFIYLKPTEKPTCKQSKGNISFSCHTKLF